MPVNPGIHFQKAQGDYEQASTDIERLNCLKRMLTLCPKHKSSESLQKEIKTKISKLKQTLEKKSKKGGFQKFSIKKEGAALICIIGPTNSGKSTLLSELTNVKVKIAPYEFTTTKPEIGILDYHGIKLQLVEIPAIIENFSQHENGSALLSILQNSDLLIYCFNNPKEKKLLDKELSSLNKKILIFDKLENFKNKIWKHLDLIKIYTKEPQKEKKYPPLALKKNSTVKDLALHIHKDFVKAKKPWARIWGTSSKFPGQVVGMDHVLQDDDVVELHKEK